MIHVGRCPPVGELAVRRRGGNKNSSKRLVDPLGEDLLGLGLELLGDGGVGHLDELGEVLGVLPREELHALLGVRLAAKVAVGRGDVVFGLAELEVARERAGPAVEVELDNVGDRLGREVALLSYAIGVAKPLSLFVETYGT